jgi:hypothetical protein
MLEETSYPQYEERLRPLRNGRQLKQHHFAIVRTVVSTAEIDCLMNSFIPALVFGGCLIIAGVLMILAQRRAQREIAGGTISAAEQAYLNKRIRRREQVAGMILLIGVMIPLGDSLIPWEKAPATFAVYWMIVIVLAAWTGLLAIGDLFATRAFMSIELNQLHRKQVELENAAQQLKRGEGNGASKH